MCTDFSSGRFFVDLVIWLIFVCLFEFLLQYFDYKFSLNYTGVNTTYAEQFQGSSTLAAQIPNVFLNWLNIFFNLG